MQLQKITFSCFTLLAAFITGSAGVKAQEPVTDTIVISRQNLAGVDVSGTIVNGATGKPLPGISVGVPEFNAAITDENGAFTLRIPSYYSTIYISGEEYQSKQVALRGRNQVRIALYEANFVSFYDESVFPYAKKPVAGSPFAVSTFSTRGNWTRPMEPADVLMQGKLAGLNVIRRSGTPSIGATMFLRGFTSLYAGNQPLIVVDGMIFDQRDYGSSLVKGYTNNPFLSIDAKDIDNITVLKDGTSMYGTKGSNGVIIITTDRTKEEATKIDFGVYSGFNFMPKTLPVLQAADYRILLSEVLKTRGWTDEQISAQPYMNDDPQNPDYYRYHNNTNWQDQVFENSFSQNIYLKVTGGDNIAKYALSMGYMKNGAAVKETDMSRYNTRFNAGLNLSKRLTVNASLSFTYYEQRLKDQGIAFKTNPVYLGLVKSPLVAVNEISSDGIKSPNLTDTDIFGTSNPVAAIDNIKNDNKSYRFFGSVNFNYNISKHLAITTLIGITYDKVRENTFIPRYGIANDTLNNAVGDSRLGSQVKRLFSLYNDNRLSYTKQINRIHNLSVHTGIRYMQTKTENDFGLGFNSATDELVSVGNGVNELRKVGGDIGKSRWLNLYVSSDYSLLDKYFLSVNMVADGSSRFGPKAPDGLTIGDRKYALTPSVAAAWLISSGRMMRNIKWMDLLKLRAGISITGNDDIGNYTAQQYYVSQNLLGLEGLVRGNIANPALQWETVQKLNAGFDLSVLNERVRASFDLFQNRTRNIILYERTPVASGFDYVVTNGGRMTTNGVDVAVNGRLVNKDGLKWDIGFTVSMYRNKVTELPGGPVKTQFADATFVTWEGNTANLFWGYTTNGVLFQMRKQELRDCVIKMKPVIMYFLPAVM